MAILNLKKKKIKSDLKFVIIDSKNENKNIYVPIIHIVTLAFINYMYI